MPGDGAFGSSVPLRTGSISSTDCTGRPVPTAMLVKGVGSIGGRFGELVLELELSVSE